MAELKLELKLRGLPVSGTKTDLIERLKPFQDTPTSSAPSTIPAAAALSTLSTLSTLTAVPMEVSTTATAPAPQGVPESMSSTPPISPLPNEPVTVLSSPVPTFRVPEEKDRRLHEKERQIEELMRKLEQEQKLVEELKMQLEVEKRGQGSCGPDSAPPQLPSVPAVNPIPTVLNANVVKREGPARSNCSTAATIPNSFLGPSAMATPLPTVVKLEDVTVSSGKPLQLPTQTQLITQIQSPAQPQVAPGPQLLPQAQRSPKVQARPQPAPPSLQQFFISHTGQAGTQILLPVSLPNNTTTIQLPSTTVSLQVRVELSRLGECRL